MRNVSPLCASMPCSRTQLGTSIENLCHVYDTEDDNYQGCVGTKCLFTHFQADNYGSSSGGSRKKSGMYSCGDNKFIDFFVS